MTKYVLSASLCIIITILLSCSNQLSPDEEIHAFIATAEKEVESRDFRELKKLISPNYNDKSNRSKKDVLRILAGYFLRNKNINILTRIDSINISNVDKSATLTVFVALSNSVIPKDNLRLLQAEIHRLDFELQKISNSWLLYSATWHRASTDDFIAD